MKRILLALTALMTIALSTNAMSYEQAQREALFLTDKMAYELNLSQEQYEAAYEINLDYLMGVTSVDDVYSDYWTRRNLDLSYILFDWQWNAFRAASYFYRPLYWSAGCWHFGVYARYPRRTFFYFDRPAIFVSYHGGHSWRANGGRSFYANRRDDFMRGGDNHFGMRDRWNRGDFRGVRDNGRGSSTRVTVNNNGNGSFSGNRTNSFNGTNRSTSTNGTSSFGSSRSNGSFSGRRTTTSTTTGTTNKVQTQSATNRFSTRSKQSNATSVPRSPSKSVGTSRSNGSFNSQRSTGSFSASHSSSVAPRTSSVAPRTSTVSPRTSSPSTTRSSGSFSGGTKRSGGFSGRR